MPLQGGGGRRARAGAPCAVDPDDREAAVAMAERLLAATDRSRVELLRRLEQRGYASATAAEAVDRVQARGWVDDARLAEGLAQRRLSHGFGRRRVRADLTARGVDADVVARVDESLAPGQAGAIRIAVTRLRRGHTGLPEPEEVRRLAGALQRRGFDSADIRAVLRRLATEGSLPGDEEG